MRCKRCSQETQRTRRKWWERWFGVKRVERCIACRKRYRSFREPTVSLGRA